MKTLFYSSIFAIFIFTSCKKEYNCECTTTKNFAGYIQGDTLIYCFDSPQTTSSRTIKEKTKENAETSCIQGNNVGYEDGPFANQGQNQTTITTVCKLTSSKRVH